MKSHPRGKNGVRFWDVLVKKIIGFALFFKGTMSQNSQPLNVEKKSTWATNEHYLNTEKAK